jgi:general secretion pathway protein H
MTTHSRRPGFGIAPRRHRRGVVLLDVVLALAILALAALILVPRPAAGVSRADMRLAGTEIAALFRKGRAQAVVSGAATDIAVNPNEGRVSAPFQERSYTLQRGIAMDWVASRVCPGSGEQRALRFLADGRSCGGVLTLNSGGMAVIIRVDWLTGRVDMDVP